MTLDDLKNKWCELSNKMSVKGIPMPVIRDPKTGQGSVSLTLVFISFNVWLVSVIGKAAGALGGMDPAQTLNMFVSCAALYWGRKLASGKDKVELDKE